MRNLFRSSNMLNNLCASVGEKVEETLVQMKSDVISFFSSNVWSIIWFAVTLLLGILIIRLILGVLKRIFKRRNTEYIAQSFILSVVRFCLYFVLVVVLLSEIGIAVSGLVAAMSAVVLAVGVALQNNIANLASGIIIVSSHLYKKGDFIVVDGKEGNVETINFLFTILYTLDKQKVIIPNSKITTESVVNVFTSPLRRVNFTFGVAYESDVELVKKTVIDVMLSNGLVKTDPAPFCALKDLSASSIDFFAYCYCDAEDYWTVYYYVMENVFNEFKRNDVSIPFGQMEVRLRKDNVKMPVIGKGIPKRVEVKKEEVAVTEEPPKTKVKAKAKAKKEKKK